MLRFTLKLNNCSDLDAVKSNKKALGAEKSDVVEAIKRWLQNARDLDGGRHRRRKGVLSQRKSLLAAIDADDSGNDRDDPFPESQPSQLSQSLLSGEYAVSNHEVNAVTSNIT